MKRPLPAVSGFTSLNKLLCYTVTKTQLAHAFAHAMIARVTKTQGAGGSGFRAGTARCSSRPRASATSSTASRSRETRAEDDVSEEEEDHFIRKAELLHETYTPNLLSLVPCPWIRKILSLCPASGRGIFMKRGRRKTDAQQLSICCCG